MKILENWLLDETTNEAGMRAAQEQRETTTTLPFFNLDDDHDDHDDFDDDHDDFDDDHGLLAHSHHVSKQGRQILLCGFCP